MKWIWEKPVRFTVLLSWGLGILLMIGWSIAYMVQEIADGDISAAALVVWELPQYGIFLGTVLVAPVILSLYNLVYLFTRGTPERRKAETGVEITTIVLGSICSVLYGEGLTEIQWGSAWFDQLYNDQVHSPIDPGMLPSLLAVALVFLLGYGILRARNINRLPPLLAVIALGGLYLGGALSIVWIVQLIPREPVLCVFPVNLILMVAKLIRQTVLDWDPETHPQGKLPRLHWLLNHGKNLPWLGLLAAVPLFGVIVGVMTLFGQAPDSIIQAWTQTSGWTLSQQVGPPNVYYDEHYLCTVAAGGHRKLVRPLREGKRHGHKVLVNRQLCVANAFEQVLEERTPRFHRVVRGVYDRFGYPIARHIRSAWAADMIWIIMKPLEWSFLAVLYLVDERPENRIAVQYPHAPLPK